MHVTRRPPYMSSSLQPLLAIVGYVSTTPSPSNNSFDVPTTAEISCRTVDSCYYIMCILCGHFCLIIILFHQQISMSVKRVFRDAVSCATIQWEDTSVLAWQGTHFWRMAVIVLVRMYYFLFD